ncbi:MAG: 5'/3'-nucleotidase SurE [Planctomycetes bacterium]|nr:5'/3'-nucleotidase SurE [Planctomycetota bacterium]
MNWLLPACLAIPLSLALGSPSQDPENPVSANEKLEILVTNDDGWESHGLQELVTALSSIANVTVSAPLENQSGSSQKTAILLGRHQVHSKKMTGTKACWALDGSPADAVTWGLHLTESKSAFDFVVSGINAGANVGDISHYSGTVGAAMEGAGHGIPSIAVSQADRSGFAQTATFVTNFIQKLGKQPPKGIVWSINVPTRKGRKTLPVKVMPMGGRYLKISSIAKGNSSDDGVTPFRSQLRFPKEADPSTDTGAYLKGFITITPLRFDWTDHAEVQRLSLWDWTS